MSTEQSLSGLIREYIQTKHNESPDYWNTVSIAQRNRDFSTFCDQQKNRGLDFQKHQSLFVNQIAKMKKSLGINPATQTKTKKPESKTFQVTSGNQKGNIKLEPKKSETQTTPTETSTTQKTDETKVLHPPVCQCVECKVKRGEMEMLDAEMCGALPEIIVDIWHMKNNRVKPLTEAQVLRVGKSLRPAFLRLFKNNETLLIYATPLLVCGQLLAEKLGEAKDPNEKKKKKKQTTRDYSDEPDENSNSAEVEQETEIPHRKMYNSAKIEKIRAEAEKEDEDENE